MSIVACKYCAKEMPDVAPACPHCGKPNVVDNERLRSVGFGLSIGIFLLPILFSWFTLRKGHSAAVKALAFTWLLLYLVIVSGNNDPESRSDSARSPSLPANSQAKTSDDRASKFISLSESKCRAFGLAIEREGWWVSEKHKPGMCTVIDRVHLYDASVELSHPEVSVTFFGAEENIVSFSVSYHPDKGSPFQQPGYLDDVFIAGLQAAGYQDIPAMGLVRSLWLRIGNTGKDLGSAIEFQARECIGDVYIDLSIMDSTNFLRNAGAQPSISESVAVGTSAKRCAPVEAQDQRPEG